MILSCPACNTRYRVDESMIPPAGRTVRCKSCGHSWHQVRPDTASASSDPAPAPATASAPEEATPRGLPPMSDTYAPMNLLAETPPAETAATPAEIVEAAPMAEPSLTSPSSFPRRLAAAEIGRPTAAARSRRLMVGWLTLAAVVIVVMAGLAGFRDVIVTAWPPAGRLYAAIGWPAHAAYGLQLSGVAVTPSTDNGKPILVLTGKIADVSLVAMAVPKLHVFLLAAENKQVLRRIEMDSGKPDLHPGETTSFSFNIEDPPREASSVRVEFATP